MNGKQFIRTRFAPTPSGFLHLGNVFSFVITAALAEKFGAAILLRIDDLDRSRVRNEYLEDIFQTLVFLGLDHHEGPFTVASHLAHHSQMLRLHEYERNIQILMGQNKVYACGCSRTALSNGQACHCRLPLADYRPDLHSLRLKTDHDRKLRVETLSGTEYAVLPEEMCDFVICSRGGKPAYQLASLCDDLQFEVDLVVRGEDLRASTLAQLYLAEELERPGFSNTHFHHHRLLTGTDGQKLSKTAGSVSAKWFRDQGKSAEDVFTAVAMALGSDERPEHWRELAELSGI